MNNLSLEQRQKITAVFAILPVLADYLQDLEEDEVFPAAVRQKHTKNLIYKIRKFDEMMLNSTTAETIKCQHDVQLWFRNEIKNNFIDDGTKSNI